MNPQDPLAALKPLRQPEAISWWPPAPGWWLLAALLLLGLALLAWIIMRRRRRTAYRRDALRKLQYLHTQYQNSQQQQHWLAQINALLKQTAIIAYPTQDIAGRSGEQWLEFLHTTAPSGVAFPAELGTAHYQRNADVDMAQLQQAAQRWIRQHRRPV